MCEATPADRCRSVRQQAIHWRCHPKRVRELIRTGVLEAFAIGNSVRISPEAAQAAERALAVRTAKGKQRRQGNGIDREVLELLNSD